ncbi:molybdenum cofactor biosynthesis protein MoaE [Streptomyces sp. SA15]|uniref:molybdenum cofactor biosynthesis protein MoaE n=1 Tax=Streptomyces sp. SA15 TaxID=934019 RepID=UPI001C533846|nr:molybdenum cofactor biosynthesis protein MoaE [Streptomyces sp. SA15]
MGLTRGPAPVAEAIEWATVPHCGAVVTRHLEPRLVMVVVAAPHREEAFTAARFCIDVLKESVPVGKREHSGDGASGWVATGCLARNPEPAA